mgnify:CR=1 FL=1
MLVDDGIAFLQMGDPSLSHELTRLADLGVTDITLVPSLALLPIGMS